MLIHELDGAHAKKIFILTSCQPDYTGQAPAPPTSAHSTPFHRALIGVSPGPLQGHHTQPCASSFPATGMTSPLLHNTIFGSLLPTRLCPGSKVCALPDLRPSYLPASSTSCHSPHSPAPFPHYPTHCSLPPSLPLKCLPTHHLGDPFP